LVGFLEEEVIGSGCMMLQQFYCEPFSAESLLTVDQLPTGDGAFLATTLPDPDLSL
jgi:hypothetical protein